MDGIRRKVSGHQDTVATTANHIDRSSVIGRCWVPRVQDAGPGPAANETRSVAQSPALDSRHLVCSLARRTGNP